MLSVCILLSICFRLPFVFLSTSFLSVSVSVSFSVLFFFLPFCLPLRLLCLLRLRHPHSFASFLSVTCTPSSPSSPSSPSPAQTLDRTNADLLHLVATFLKKLSVYEGNKDIMIEMEPSCVQRLVKFVPCSQPQITQLVLKLLMNLSFDIRAKELMVRSLYDSV